MPVVRSVAGVLRERRLRRIERLISELTYRFEKACAIQSFEQSKFEYLIEPAMESAARDHAEFKPAILASIVAEGSVGNVAIERADLFLEITDRLSIVQAKLLRVLKQKGSMDFGDVLSELETDNDTAVYILSGLLSLGLLDSEQQENVKRKLMTGINTNSLIRLQRYRLTTLGKEFVANL